ncbi:MAG: pilus assembly protein TadD [Chitinophagales bacterium]|nr:pilus assembly protein TadD [Chitinophagales bacterium]
MKRNFIIALLFGCCLFVLLYCNTIPEKKASQPLLYKNWSDTVHYVGMQTCRTCHENIYNTFIQTGMGQSWDHATKNKSSAKFDQHAYVYDPYKNFWYHPYWKNDSLYIMEYRLSGRDTTYRRVQKISYIVGSGQHTNSHIWTENGYLYQAPITFYTQKGIWDLPPGFDQGMNTRFSRIISVECMNCHNMYPRFDSTSENKFISVKTGIECERCHGAGGEHVREKLQGIIVDTSKEIDYSIVNPGKLSRDLQVELCQRCHLQGITVLNEGKSYFDFHPGMPLNTVMNVFMPRYEGGQEKFIMASHADRMKQSRCYLNSNMTCLTCHNPHVSVKFTSNDRFNNACQSCHSGNASTECTLPISQRIKENNNCFKCHMPVSETIDIPNVTVHDHRIQIPLSKKAKNEILRFVGLECLTTKKPSLLLLAQGYLETYEAFSPQPFLLDSADKFLSQMPDKDNFSYRQEMIRYFFLKNNYDQVVAHSLGLEPDKIPDAWTCYRIGEGYFQSGDLKNALAFYKHAAEIKSSNPEFMNKLGTTLTALNRIDEAGEVFYKITQENAAYAPALSNLGYVYLLKGDLQYAGSLFDKALAIDPDYTQAILNKIALALRLQKNEDAKQLAQRLLKIEPDNEKAKTVIKQLSL